jgi:hypothetical protein
VKQVVVICGLAVAVGVCVGAAAPSEARIERASDVVASRFDHDSQELVLADGAPPSADDELSPAWFNVHVIRSHGQMFTWFNVHRLAEVMLLLRDGVPGRSGASREGLPIP